MTSYSRRQLVQGAGVVGLGLLAGCGRLPGQAQPSPRVWRIGRLSISGLMLASANASELTNGLHELGYVEGVNLQWEDAFAAGDHERLRALATALAQRPVDLIVTAGAPEAVAARNATSTIPIVMGIVGDPVAIGVVASLARPGGNVTGLSSLSPQMSGKRLELLRDALPGLARVAVVWNAADPVKALDYRETEEAARALALMLLSLPVRTVEEFEEAFEAARRQGADALIALGDALTSPPANVQRLVDLAAERRLPLMLEPRHGAYLGALLTYGPNQPAMWRRSAAYIDRILKGAKPADLPVEQPMTFDFVVNMKTAQALGITFPNDIMLQVTEVIQ
jgi:putative tryptophan/tyrosine transport system substrate-binding protein